jgi:hypothetical protein
MRIGRGNRTTRREPVPVPLYPTHIPYEHMGSYQGTFEGPGFFQLKFRVANVSINLFTFSRRTTYDPWTRSHFLYGKFTLVMYRFFQENARHTAYAVGFRWWVTKQGTTVCDLSIPQTSGSCRMDGEINLSLDVYIEGNIHWPPGCLS